MNINTFLESLAANNSRNFKIEQLNANSDNELLREVVRLALDPFTQFYQRKIPAYARDPKFNTMTLGFALNQLCELSNRNVTGNAAITGSTYIQGGLNVTGDGVLLGDLIVGVFSIEHAKAIVVFGGKHHVFHACVFGGFGPTCGVELSGVEGGL